VLWKACGVVIGVAEIIWKNDCVETLNGNSNTLKHKWSLSWVISNSRDSMTQIADELRIVPGFNECQNWHHRCTCTCMCTCTWPCSVPRRMPTATRTASSVKRSPHAEMGIADSQSIATVSSTGSEQPACSMIRLGLRYNQWLERLMAHCFIPCALAAVSRLRQFKCFFWKTSPVHKWLTGV